MGRMYRRQSMLTCDARVFLFYAPRLAMPHPSQPFLQRLVSIMILRCHRGVGKLHHHSILVMVLLHSALIWENSWSPLQLMHLVWVRLPPHRGLEDRFQILEQIFVLLCQCSTW